MAACQIPGHAGSYGLGIRIAFYLQWFGMIITCWFLESDALNLKFLNGLTIVATTIGLALHLSVLQPAEIYVVLLLACGTLYFLVPVYIWRVITCCHARMDIEQWNRIRMGWPFRIGMALISGTLLGMQIWFWCTGVYARPLGTDRSCQQYGFFFGQMLLDSPALAAINIIIHITMLIMGIWLFCDEIGMFDDYRWRRRRKRLRWSITQDRIVSLQQLHTILDVIVAAILIMAIELIISWNNISRVNNVDSAAQLIPLVISAAYFLRSIYVWMFGPETDDNNYREFPLFDGGSGGSYMYTFSEGGNQHRRTTDDWAGRKRHSHHHHRRRRTAQMDHGAGEPVMSTAYSRRATVIDGPNEGLAAGHVPVEPQPVHENA